MTEAIHAPLTGDDRTQKQKDEDARKEAEEKK